MRRARVALLVALVISLLPLVGESGEGAVAAASSLGRTEAYELKPLLSPIWGAAIHRWSAQIITEAEANGLDPDLIAAVMEAESNGIQSVVSYAGAVGLMGVMPAGPGLEWRPTSEELLDPDLNLNWGVAILNSIIRQSGGDVSAALAAYNGGWDQATKRVTQNYARGVLDDYARAIAVRSGISPDIASEWTLAIEIRRGYIPPDPLILHDEALSGLRTYGEHVVFFYTDEQGRTYYVKGYAVPLALVVPLEAAQAKEYNDSVDKQLLARLGLNDTKISTSNPRVLTACLPSLNRLRGRMSTRWFAPSGCPSWHR